MTAVILKYGLRCAPFLVCSLVFSQDPKRLYESAELEFQKGNYVSALSYLRQLEAGIGKKTPRVNALKAKVQESDGNVLDAKLSIEEYLRMANGTTRASEGYVDIPALKAKIDNAMKELETRWPQEIQKRRMEEADRIIQEQEAIQERKLQAMHSVAAQFEIREWQGATQDNNADGYKAFIERYPHSSKIKEARSRAEAASFREATADNSASAFREFLAEYPQSVFTLKAKDRYESLLYAKAVQENSAEAAAEYLKEFPNGRYAPVMKQRTSSANEDELYTAAVNESRSPVYRYYAYRRYVRAYPKGKYDEIVRRDLAAQKLEATRPFGETSWLDNFDRGVQAMEAGRNEEAAARFLRAIEQREQDSENILLTDGRRVNYLPHRELGICLIELGVTDFAKVELQLSISYIWTLRTQEALNRL